MNLSRRGQARLAQENEVQDVSKTGRSLDAIFADPRLAATYDVFEGDRDDLNLYEAIVDELDGHSVLDIGCGTGELACRLARRDLAVTGVDPSAALVDIARSKPGADRVAWIVGDTASLPPMQVEMATMTTNVAQVFITDEEWMATLLATRNALCPGGHLVFETRDPTRRAWEHWTPAETHARTMLASGETVETWCEVLSVDEALVTFRWTSVFESDGATLISDSTLRFRGRDEVERSLVDAGYELIETRDAPDRPGKEMVFIARYRSPGQQHEEH